MILCVGESLIDMVPREDGFTPLAGGAVYNTAVALGRLGAPTSYMWPISRDPFGQTLLRPLAEAAVDISLAPRSDRLTTVAFVTLIASNAHYAFYDEGSAGRMFTPEDIPEIPDHISALFIGGISLVPEPCGSTVETLVDRLHGRVPIMIDPNIRPFFVSDEGAYRARLDRLLARADLVKLSQDDLDWLMPDTSMDEAAEKLIAQGAKAVFLTGGAEGARAINHDLTGVDAPAVRVQVADTIGAGDTFNAGVLAALYAREALTCEALKTLDAETLQAALINGTRAAAITVSRPGANPPWARELAELPG